MNQDTNSHRWAARLFGIFFILAFLSYGTGTALVASIVDGPEGLSGIADGKTVLITGVLLMAILHSIFNIGLSVLAFPALNTVSGYAARGYLAAGIAATTTVVIGALFFTPLVSLSEVYAAGDTGTGTGTGTGYFDAIKLVLSQAGFYGYQISMTLWGIGGLILCTTLFVSRLVPRPLAVWGFLGYVVFMIGTTAEMFGYSIGVMLALPGGLFELSLSLWLIFKGFNLPKAAE